MVWLIFSWFNLKPSNLWYTVIIKLTPQLNASTKKKARQIYQFAT